MPLSNKNGSNAKSNNSSTDPPKKRNARTQEEELERQIIQKLASRSYHLPGYKLFRDWTQYLFNNHPVLGICFHHKLHPLKTRQRLIILLGSFFYGVAITNIIYLWFLGTGRDDQEEVFALDLSATNGRADDEQAYSTNYSVTSGLLLLITVGSGSHAVFDRFVWTLSACGCCRSGGRFGNCGCVGAFCKTLAFSLAIILVVAVVALATCAVVVRATVEESQLKVPFFENNLSENRTEVSMQESLELNDILDEFDVTDYSFLRGYALEFFVSLFVYYPFIETVLFSGILGCGCIPILGGRPLSMKKELLKQSDGRCVCPSDLA
mmetsp:Transcript_18850/g.28601  ORF Transcript_18850/g.28601 Transcript_18850/m.28601 type:complete len:323 (+) Transcript_18850:117-1085(+)|eukprot:CAMPEP_0196140978 /NCGR_PEP_ID=MMETSP0910-20130528/8159_1 /TAXON_ID=49265 /ORGANISM="Thalassiosira rotula, Strain GSO102" /LENGTH=322 /DNA_ID=CAMNT_0041401965 /DNA_START=117 /DNA_END=1085 /DNA_ORIENTATION=+